MSALYCSALSLTVISHLTSHIFLSLHRSVWLCPFLPYRRLQARSVPFPRVLYLESYDVEKNRHRWCVRYFCWTMRELRKHTHWNTSEQILRHSSFFVIHLSFQIFSHRHDGQWTLSFPPSSLSFFSLIYHSESMSTSKHMTTHAVRCLPVCLHQSA